MPAVAPVSAVSSSVGVATVVGDDEADALAEVEGTTAPPDADALADGDEDALADVDADAEPAAPDADGAGELVVGLAHAASTPSTSTNNIMNEKRCFIRSVTPHTEK